MYYFHWSSDLFFRYRDDRILRLPEVLYSPLFRGKDCIFYLYYTGVTHTLPLTLFISLPIMKNYEI